jgi:signal peptidase II
MKKKKEGIFYFLIGIGIVLFDQITKWLAISLLSGTYAVTPWLTFHLVLNRGFAFGMFSSSDTLSFLLITASIIIITLIVSAAAYIGFLNNHLVIGELLILSGSFSNLIDRFVYHGVVDFIQLSCKGWLWPVFNLADCSIVLGVILILLIQKFR